MFKIKRELSNTNEIHCSVVGTCDYYYSTSFEHKCRYFDETLGDLMVCCAKRCKACTQYHKALDSKYFERHLVYARSSLKRFKDRANEIIKKWPTWKKEGAGKDSSTDK